MRFKYSAPINPWACRGRQTVQQVFRWGVKPERRPTLRYDIEVWRVGRRNPNRFAVGFIRAGGAVNFFRGCYHGAEND